MAGKSATNLNKTGLKQVTRLSQEGRIKCINTHFDRLTDNQIQFIEKYFLKSSCIGNCWGQLANKEKMVMG